jgi:hypothetical protein
MHRLFFQRSATLVTALLLAGCATEYHGFDKPERITGGGGEKSSFHGLDLWTAGLPQREFEVIGEISDNRPCGALAMCVRGSRIASLAKEQGGDALILGYDGVGIKGRGLTSGLSTAETPSDLLNTPMKREVSKYYVIRYLNPPL